MDLDGQFRCGGSEIYVRWVEQLLGLRPGGPQPWPGDDTFQLLLADSPEQMEDELRRKMDDRSTDDRYIARITAGFCWPWSKPRLDGTLVDDVVIGAWSRPWNLRSDKALNGIPPSSLWATDDAGFGQVGCIYTAQGFEYDYGGVIMGADLVWRDDHWEPSPAASRDPDLRNADNFDELVRNTYKVLLTRGLRGCIIYSVDEETRHMLAGLAIPHCRQPPMNDTSDRPGTACVTWPTSCGLSPRPGTGSSTTRPRTSPWRWPGRPGNSSPASSGSPPANRPSIMHDPARRSQRRIRTGGRAPVPDPAGGRP